MQFIERVCEIVYNWHKKSAGMNFAEFKMLNDFISQAYSSC